MTGEWVSWWEPSDSPFPAYVTHPSELAAHAHAIFVTNTTGCPVEVRRTVEDGAGRPARGRVDRSGKAASEGAGWITDINEGES